MSAISKIKNTVYWRTRTLIDKYVRQRDLSYIFGAISSEKPRSLIMVGSNSGQEVGFYKKYFDEIHLVDPLIPKLKMSSACRSMGVHLHAMAISDTPGDRSFFVASNGGESSSLRNPSHHLTEYPHITFEGDRVRASRLAEFNFFSAATVLILDVQGAEVDVLRSAIPVGLQHLAVILCEYSLVPLYEGSGSLDDIVDLLQEFGFKLAFTTSPYLSKSECTGDALFVKSDFFAS